MKLENILYGAPIVGGIVGAGVYGYSKGQGIELHPDILKYSAQFGGIAIPSLYGCVWGFCPSNTIQDPANESIGELAEAVLNKTALGAFIGTCLSAVAFGVGYVSGKVF